MSTERSLVVLSLILVVALLSLKLSASGLISCFGNRYFTGRITFARYSRWNLSRTPLCKNCRIYRQCSADHTPHIFCGRATIFYPIRTLKHQNLFRNFWKKTPNFASMCFKFLKSDFLLLFFPCIFQRRSLRTDFYATDGSSLCCTNSYDWMYISDY